MTASPAIDITIGGKPVRLRIPGRRILVRKDFNDHIRGPDGKVLVYKPDRMVEFTRFGTIIAVGAKCTEFCQADVGWHIECPERASGMHDGPEENTWFFDEAMLDRGMLKGYALKP